MKNLKYAWLLVVLLMLAACGQVPSPQVDDAEEPTIEVLDVLNVDRLGTTSATVNLGPINPGTSASQLANLYVQCDKNKHADIGTMGFAITGGTAEVSAVPSLSIPQNGANAWPADNTSCASQAQVANGSLNITVRVPSDATSGTRSVTLTVTSNDTDLKGNGKVEVTVNYNVVAATPTDSTPPTVNVTLPSPGTSDWFTTSPVAGTVSANDPSNVAEITCSGATVSNTTGLGTTSASATLTVSAQGVHNITCTAKDGANNSGAASGSSNTGTVKIDTVAPTVNPANVNDTDWRKTPLSQEFTASDSGSNLADTGDASFTLTASAESTKDGSGNVVPTEASRTVSDRAGNTTTRSVSARIDTTNPTITASAKTADGQDYTSGDWTNQNVTVSFTCSDALSGIPQGICPEPVTVSSNTVADGQSISDSVSDRAGNSAVSNAVIVKIDKAKPTITASAGSYDGNWTNQNVTVSFTCSDALSGIAQGICPEPVTVSSNTVADGQSISDSVSDRAGNSETSNTITVKVDKSAPSVNVTGGVSTGATYTLGSVPTAGCSTSDTLSGVKTHATLGSSVGGPVGEVTVNCTGAADNAGNLGSASVTYNVIYNFTGFFSPVDMNGVYNVAKAGSAIPVKFKLGGNQGLGVISKIDSFRVTCPSSGALDTLEETASGTTSGLKYDALADQYNYTWKTATTLAGTCQRLEMQLVDGKTYSALFKFNK